MKNERRQHLFEHTRRGRRRPSRVHLAADDKFTASGSNGSGRWLAVDGRRAVMLFDNGWLNVLTFDDGLTTTGARESQPKPGWKGKRSKRD